MVPVLNDLDYVERLKAMDLPTLYYRRDRGDMIESYKYMHNLYNTQQMMNLDDQKISKRTFTKNENYRQKISTSLLLREGCQQMEFLTRKDHICTIT